MALFLGVMTGTSMDALDIALVDFKHAPGRLLACQTSPLPDKLRTKLQALQTPGDNELHLQQTASIQLGQSIAEAILNLLKQEELESQHITSIGCHGQTLRHCPNKTPAYSTQIGDPNIIALNTHIATCFNFRTQDILLGGQGAPLAPGYHAYALRSECESRFIVNIGGISNITYLPQSPHAPIIGFDTGPGNTLLDHWIQHKKQQAYDLAGAWARGGTICQPLLNACLNDTYFSTPPPKSTGLDYFNATWLQDKLAQTTATPSAQAIQATLTELTAQSIRQATQSIDPTAPIFLCGGGAYNTYLLERIQANNQTATVNTTETLGISPQWVEAMLMAWLAKQLIDGNTANIPSVTGASKATVLGSVCGLNYLKQQHDKSIRASEPI